MDYTTIVAILAACSAIGAAVAGERSFYWSGKTVPDVPPPGGMGYVSDAVIKWIMDNGQRASDNARARATQSTATWLAVATALFGVALARPAGDAIGHAFAGLALLFGLIGGIWNAVRFRMTPGIEISAATYRAYWFSHRTRLSSPRTDAELLADFAKHDPESARGVRLRSRFPFL